MCSNEYAQTSWWPLRQPTHLSAQSRDTPALFACSPPIYSVCEAALPSGRQGLRTSNVGAGGSSTPLHSILIPPLTRSQEVGAGGCSGIERRRLPPRPLSLLPYMVDSNLLYSTLSSPAPDVGAGVAGAGGCGGRALERVPGGPRLAQRAHHAHRRVLILVVLRTLDLALAHVPCAPGATRPAPHVLSPGKPRALDPSLTGRGCDMHARRGLAGRGCGVPAAGAGAALCRSRRQEAQSAAGAL